MVDPSDRTCGFAGELSSRISSELFWHLDGPVKRVTRADVPISYSPPEESYVTPGESDIERAIQDTTGGF